MTKFMGHPMPTDYATEDQAFREGWLAGEPAFDRPVDSTVMLQLSAIDRVTLIDAMNVFVGRLPTYVIDDPRYDSIAKLLTLLGYPTTVDELKPER